MGYCRREGWGIGGGRGWGIGGEGKGMQEGVGRQKMMCPLPLRFQGWSRLQCHSAEVILWKGSQVYVNLNVSFYSLVTKNSAELLPSISYPVGKMPQPPPLETTTNVSLISPN